MYAAAAKRQARGLTDCRKMGKTSIAACGVAGRKSMPLTIEVEQEEDGRWIADVPEFPGVMAYGQTRQAIARAEALALRVIADRNSDDFEQELVAAADKLFHTLDAEESKDAEIK
jgi:predicted RNase H-like HicB family nuclease